MRIGIDIDDTGVSVLFTGKGNLFIDTDSERTDGWAAIYARIQGNGRSVEKESIFSL